MDKAYDTIIQSKVTAEKAAKNGNHEANRYTCLYCHEEVILAAGVIVAPYFKHRSGNNNKECDDYVRTCGESSTDLPFQYSKADFYFNKDKKIFSLELCFSNDEIIVYEQDNAAFELRTPNSEQAFSTILINKKNFIADIPTPIHLKIFSYNYFLSDTLYCKNNECKVFKAWSRPTIFKMQGNDGNKMKLDRSTVLYTEVFYCFIFQHQHITLQSIISLDGIQAEEPLIFETMGEKFLGIPLTIVNRTDQAVRALEGWGYKLETSETLTLLWPPANQVNGISLIDTETVFLFSSFELKKSEKINVYPTDIIKISNNLSRVRIKSKVYITNRNSEIIIDKNKHTSHAFDNITIVKESTNKYTVPNDDTYFLYSRLGIKRLSKGQSVYLTPQSEIRHFFFGYLVGCIYPEKQKELTGELLLSDMLNHYKRKEKFYESMFDFNALTETASRYIITECKTTGFINPVVKQFIIEGNL